MERRQSRTDSIASVTPRNLSLGRSSQTAEVTRTLLQLDNLSLFHWLVSVCSVIQTLGSFPLSSLLLSATIVLLWFERDYLLSLLLFQQEFVSRLFGCSVVEVLIFTGLCNLKGSYNECFEFLHCSSPCFVQ